MLSGKRVLITGASSGFGEYFARIAVKAGADVAICARRVPRLEELAEELMKAHAGRSVVPIQMDVTDNRSIKSAFDTAEAQIGVIDVLVNNAGFANPTLVLDMEEDDWDGIMDTNLRGAFFVAQESAKRMVKAKLAGSIINIASILGIRQGTSQLNYGVAKSGMIQMTKVMGLEFTRNNIRCNALAPGYFNTEMNEEFFSTPKGKEYIQRIPPKRLGELHELDGPFMLLASDQSSFMTGQVIAVDGGHLLSAL